MDIKFVEERYSKMSDEELIRISTTNAKGLRPEVFGIIENEVKKRNLNPDILKGAKAQNKEYTLEEVSAYSNQLRDLACPICKSNSNKLNGTTTHKVKSFILFSSYDVETIIACPTCLNKKNNDAMISTVLLGWWGIPWGLINTPRYLLRNFNAKKHIRDVEPNDALLAFTLENIGQLETYKNQPEKLSTLLEPERFL